MSGSTEPVPDDLEDIFGFKAAKERLEQGTKLTIQNPDNKNDASFIKHRVFMNCVDSFNSRYIAAYITDQIYGASRIMGMDEAQGEEEANQNMEVIPQNKYEVIGTMQFGFHKPTEDILFTLSDEDEEKFHVELLKCGYIIYDITQNPDEIKKAINTLNFLEAEIEKIKEIGPKTFSRLEEERIFILISTVMTWGKTKPLNPRDPTLAYTESKYKKRKAHPNYEDHIACEREVVLRGRKDKDHLKTYVVCSGIVYGEEELDLTPIFKLAWLNESYLPCFYPGTNSVPLIHVGDLARVLHKLMDINPGTPQYILAVEPSPTSLKKILVALSKALGSGRTKNVSQAEAFLYNEFNQRFFDVCTLDIRMEPEFVSDALQVDWQTELNIAQNMKRIAEQFVIKRHLISKKIILHGPPASGKTRLAKMLAEKYGLHYISIATMIEDIVENLRNNIEDEQLRLEEARERAKEKEILEKDDEDEEIDEEEMEEEDVGGNIEEWEEQIREIRVVFKESPDQKIPDEMVIRLLRSYLLQNKCQYQGYVIDGYPKTYQQAKEIFGQSAEGGGEEGGAGEGEDEFEEMIGNASSKLLPHFVISLKASDDFLNARVMALPESQIQNTHYDEKGMIRRLAEFRANNTEDNSMLNFFDEIEIHPIIINIEDDDLTLDCILEYLSTIVGEPNTFGLTPEEEVELNRLQEENERLREEQEKLRAKAEENECQIAFQDKMEEWTDMLQKYQKEEEKVLTAKAEPLRFYLMRYVFPVLIRGLVETAKVKPPEPLTFLAEFLFKENPEGKMFDPSYTEDGETLLVQYETNIEGVMLENIPDA